MTEVERYEKRPPKTKNGKVPPQQLWMHLISESITTAPRHLKHHLRAMSSLDNVPRKEKSFRNFTANSLNLRGNSGEAIVSEIWKFLKDLREKQQQQSKQQEADATAEAQKTKGTTTDQHTETDKKEAAPASVEDGSSADEKPPSTTADKETSNSAKSNAPAISSKAVKKAMKKALKKATDHSLTVKALRKTVRSELECDKKLLKDLVSKNLKSSDNFIVDGRRVTLKLD